MNILRPQIALLVILSAVVFRLAGCSSAPPPPAVDAPVYNTLDEIKTRLSEVAQNGDGGSSLMGLSESVEKLKTTDAQKGELLAKGVAQLDAAGTPAQRKAIAAKLLKEL